MKKEHSNGLSRNLVGAIVLVLGIAAAFALFYSSNVRRITRQNENYIADIAFQRADLIEDLFRENLAYIDSAAIVLETEFENQEIDAAKLNVPDESDIDATELAQVADILRIYEERFAFDYLRFIDLYGRDYTTGEKVIAANVSEREYFRKGMQGQSGMTYILDSKVTSERQIGFYSPVRQNGEIAGLVVGFYGEAFIGKLLSVSLFDYDCDVLLCDRDGNIIYNTGKDGAGLTNFLEGLDTLAFAGDEDRQMVSQAFSKRGNALYNYQVDGQETVGCTAYVGDDSEFFLILNFPPSAYREMVRNANNNGVMLLAMLIGLFLMAGAYYFVRSLAQKKRLLEESRNSNDIHFAMSRLFENFVLVNAKTRTYHYIEGMPDVGHIPNDGPYSVFAEDLLDRFPGEAERKEAQELISFDHLVQEMNRGANIVSYNLHAPICEEEWFTYNFIVVSRDKEDKVLEFLVARQDITKLQEKEEENRRILEQARDEAEKGNRAKTAFLSSMSHDIRTPMNAIIGYTNIALDRIEDTELVRNSLNKISASGQYLLSLINDVLDMSKIESGKLQLHEDDCDLRQVFERIADMTRSQASKKRLDVSFDVSGISHPAVKVDELRLEQVLINITGNAVKYTENGGSIVITAAEDPDWEENGKRRYRFSVKDTGIGISPDYLPHIFESFSRETNSTINKIQGTGLGMSITSKLVNLMGGTIAVESELNVGSVFTVTLELLTRDESETDVRNDAETPETGHDLTGRRVLLVEDNDINAEIANLVLSGFGVTTERAENGRAGLELVREKGEGYYDAVLMDIQMPVMNGYEATREIRKLPGDYIRRLPIIAMSANAYEEDIRAALDSGMNGHIAKPFDPEMLARELHQKICRQ